MSAKLVVGTIRARQGERHVVALPDGRTTLVTFEGEGEPAIGGDVIGLIDLEDPNARLKLVPNVSQLLLKRRAKIVIEGRPEVTATMLARILEGSGIGAMRPGTGGIIERTPTVDDPDLAWALNHLSPVAADLGYGLNVVDPLAVAGASWDDHKLRDELLPADAVGERGALSDLKRLLGEGITPTCRRTLFRLNAQPKGPSVPSVDFILPYSPFATGLYFSASLAGANRAELPRRALSGSDARRLSAYREIALAFAPRYLGRWKSPAVAAHAEAAFADAAAAIAFLNDGGDPQAIRTFAALRESGFARSNGNDSAAPATHMALAAVLSVGGYLEAGNAHTAMTLAASLARGHAPSNLVMLGQMHGKAKDKGVLVDLERSSPMVRQTFRELYREDCEEVASRLAGNELALDRMSRFGAFMVPVGLQDIFEDVLDASGAPYRDPEEVLAIHLDDDFCMSPASPGL